MGFRSLPQLLWSNLAATVNVRARKVIVGSGMALVDHHDGTATISATGTNTLAADTDVAISSPADTEVLTYDSGLSKWKNAAASGGGGGGTNANTVDVTVSNQTAFTITKGSVVNWWDAVDGSGVPQVIPSDTADTPTFGFPFGVLTEDLTAGGTATCRVVGIVSGLDTSGILVGRDVYSGASGAFTTSGSNGCWVGLVTVSDATIGKVYVGCGLANLNMVQYHGHSGFTGITPDGGALVEPAFLETSTPGLTPASAHQYVYIDSTTHHLTRKNSSNVVTDIETAGAGSVASDAIWDAKGDLAAGTGANTATKVTAGADDTILMADSAQTTGLKWVASQTPSTQAFGDSAAQGTADTYARGDHKHAMPAAPTTVATDTIFDAKGDLAVGTGADTSAKLTVGTNDFVLTAASGETTGLKWAAASGGSGFYSAYLCYQDQQTTNTNGGTFTSGAWRTRVLNTEVADTGNHGSVASNQITLDSGTYDYIISAPGFFCNRHAARLQDITNTLTIKSGSSEYSGTASATQSRSVIAGTFTLSGSTVLEVQHQCETTSSSNGFGVAAGSVFTVGTEVYTVAQFWKRA